MRPLALIALVTAVGCATPGIEPVDAPARLAAAESAFAAQSVREGMKAAFLAWLAPGATLFRAGPVDGRAEIARNPDPPIVLDWRPAFVEVAASGDFGLSTGPWRIRSKADPSRPERHGQFISVWRRASGSDWRVWVDVGVSNPGPALWDAPLVATTVPRTGPVAGTVAQAEAAFTEMAARSGDAAAYAAFASAGLRAYRDGHVPFIGRDAWVASPVAQRRQSWTLDRHETSEAGDFAFTVGRLGAPGGAKAGDYVRVWRREAGGWRIALDVVDEVKPK